MAEEVKVVITAEAGKSAKTVKDLGKDLEKAAKSGDKVASSIKGVDTAGLSVKKQLKALKDQMSEIGDIGSPQFQKLAKEAGVLKDKMNNANSAIKSMSSDFPKLQVGIQAMQGIGAAAQFAAGAQLLLGSENKELAKAMQRAMALTTMMSSVQALANLLSDEAMLGQKLRTSGLWKHLVAMKTWIAQTKLVILWNKVLNAVMKANPIGLLITAIGLLITAWAVFGDGLKKVGEFFIWFRDIMVEALNWIGSFFDSYGEAIETNSMKERKAAEEKKAQHEELSRQNAERLDALKKEREALEETHKKNQDRFDTEIEINKLLGKSTKALTQSKLDDELAFSQEQARIIAEMIASWTKYYEDLFVLSGKSREDFMAQMKGQGIDLDALLLEAEELQVSANDRIRLNEAKLVDFKLKGQKKVTDGSAAEAKKQAAIEKKLIAQRLKQEAKAQKDWEKLQEERAKLRDKLLKQTRDANADDFQIKMNKLKDDHEKQMELLNELIPEENELRLQLEQDFQDALQEIQSEADASDEAARVDKIKKQEEAANQVFDSAESLLKTAESLNTIFHGKELKRIEAKQARGEKLSASEEKRLRKEAQIQKAFALAQIAIDTARAIAGAVAAGSAIPFPGNIPAIIAGVAAVMSNVAAASELIGSAPPSVSSGGDIAEASSEASQDAPIRTQVEGSTLLNQEPNTVVVVESITDGINSVDVIEAQASFG